MAFENCSYFGGIMGNPCNNSLNNPNLFVSTPASVPNIVSTPTPISITPVSVPNPVSTSIPVSVPTKGNFLDCIKFIVKDFLSTFLLVVFLLAVLIFVIAYMYKDSSSSLNPIQQLFKNGPKEEFRTEEVIPILVIEEKETIFEWIVNKILLVVEKIFYIYLCLLLFWLVIISSMIGSTRTGYYERMSIVSIFDFSYYGSSISPYGTKRSIANKISYIIFQLLFMAAPFIYLYWLIENSQRHNSYPGDPGQPPWIIDPNSPFYPHLQGSNL